MELTISKQAIRRIATAMSTFELQGMKEVPIEKAVMEEPLSLDEMEVLRGFEATWWLDNPDSLNRSLEHDFSSQEKKPPLWHWKSWIHASQAAESLNQRTRLEVQKMTDSVCSTLKACIPNTKCTVCLQAILGMQVILCAAFEAQIMIKTWPKVRSAHVFVDWTERAAVNMLQVQAGAVVFETCYQFILGLNTVRTRNIVHVYGICLNNVSILLFVTLTGICLDRQFEVYRRNKDEHHYFGPKTGDAYEQIAVPQASAFAEGFGAILGVLALCILAVVCVIRGLYGQFAW